MSRFNIFMAVYVVIMAQLPWMLRLLPWRDVLQREAPLFADVALGVATTVALATVAIGVRAYRNAGRPVVTA